MYCYYSGRHAWDCITMLVTSIGPLAVNGSQPSSIMRSTSSSTKYRTCVTRYPHVSTLQSPKRTERQSNIDCTWVQVVQSAPGKDLVARFSTSCEYIKSINSVTGNEMQNKHGIPVQYIGKTWKLMEWLDKNVLLLFRMMTNISSICTGAAMPERCKHGANWSLSSTMDQPTISVEKSRPKEQVAYFESY